ncbi:MAG TPA: glycine cleavage system protein H [Polyangia bacterium]|jgi:glycine cleavage system H lipoate-binding protein
MHGHDFLSLYAEKTIEYCIAIGFLLCFIPFWRYVMGRKAEAREAVRVAPGLAVAEPRWFHVPEAVWLHPGHAWAELVGTDTVRVGLDDFAHRLVGAIKGLRLPAAGTQLGQGEKGWSIAVEDVELDMLAPVDGTVTKVNDRVTEKPDLLTTDPYGTGWLLEIKSARLAANLKQLAKGPAAERLLSESMERLERMVSPELGALAADGGLPVDGIARSLDPKGWAKVARSFFLTEGAHE